MNKPITFDELFPNRFLHGSDFVGREVVVKISAVHIEELEGTKGKQMTGILSLEGKAKQMTLNKTNALALKGMFGPVATDWVGKRFQIYTVKIEVNHEIRDAIRVRGSPDIAANIEFKTQLGRKSGVVFKLFKTAEPGTKPPAGRAATKPAPAHATAETAEIPTGVDDSGAPWAASDAEPENDIP